jgi:hypothetical protein
MPTFFNPGGRTLAGGDIIPWVMPWPNDDRVMTITTNVVTRIRLELLVVFGTAYLSEPRSVIPLNPGPQFGSAIRVEQAFRPAIEPAPPGGFSPEVPQRLKPPQDPSLDAALKRCSTQNPMQSKIQCDPKSKRGPTSNAGPKSNAAEAASPVAGSA